MGGNNYEIPEKGLVSFRALPKQNFQARPLNKHSAHHVHINPTVTLSKLHNIEYKQSRSSLC